MTTEIKIQYEQVAQALESLYKSIQSIDPTFQITIGGDNRLEVVTKLNELNIKLQKANTLYKEILTLNEELTGQSVEYMKETDKQLSTAIAQ
ncbi:YwqI/YxiC family protein [Lysinibacillus sp. 54212]|uniref:YwqI/YxiC family protein n=1 Tax=Lysinibacillus sp. 54212 TaxID=3119829 RepID=UPI002FC645F4